MNALATDNKASVDSGVETSNDSNDDAAAAAAAAAATTATQTDTQYSDSAQEWHTSYLVPALWKAPDDSRLADRADCSISWVKSLLPMRQDYEKPEQDARCIITEMDQPGSSLSADITCRQTSSIISFHKKRRAILYSSELLHHETRKESRGIRKRCSALSEKRRHRVVNAFFKASRDSWPTRCEINLAATTNNVELMKHLLENRAEELQSESKNAALVIACQLGYAEIARLLLEHGADAKSRSPGGTTSLNAAINAGHFSVVTLLLAADPNLLSFEQFGRDALKLAEIRLADLQLSGDADMTSVKAETINIINLLLACLKKQRGFEVEVDALSNVCSRLSLSNTAEQVQDQVSCLLSSIDSLRLKG